MSRSMPAGLGLVVLLLFTPAGAQPAVQRRALPEFITHGHAYAELRSLLPEALDRPDALEGRHLTGAEDVDAGRSPADGELQSVVTPSGGWDLFLGTGDGLRRNDLRAAMAHDDGAVRPTIWGAEGGTRLSLLDRRLDLAAMFWVVHLESASASVIDEGRAELSDFTDPSGVDLEVRFRILPWLWTDATLTFGQATYLSDAGGEVTLARTFTGEAGLSVLHPSGWRGRLGARWVQGRPAADADDPRLQAEGHFLVDLTVAYRWRFLEVGVLAASGLDAVDVRGTLALSF